MFKGDYLRVLTPETIDGVNLKYRNNRPVYKEAHLPLSARKHIERKNAKLPEQLRKKIELVSSYAPPPPEQETIEQEQPTATETNKRTSPRRR